MNISLSSLAPENVVSRDGFDCPVPRQPANIHTHAESGTTREVFNLIPVFMVTKSYTKILNFSTRFSCQHFAVEDFVTLLGKNIVDGEMSCLGTVSTNLFRLFYAGEIQNLNCRRLEMATYFS